MAPWVKVPAPMSEDPRSISRTHMIEGEIYSCKLSSNLHQCTATHRAHNAHIHTNEVFSWRPSGILLESKPN